MKDGKKTSTSSEGGLWSTDECNGLTGQKSDGTKGCDSSKNEDGFYCCDPYVAAKKPYAFNDYGAMTASGESAISGMWPGYGYSSLDWARVDKTSCFKKEEDVKCEYSVGSCCLDASSEYYVYQKIEDKKVLFSSRYISEYWDYLLTPIDTITYSPQEIITTSLNIWDDSWEVYCDKDYDIFLQGECSDDPESEDYCEENVSPEDGEGTCDSSSDIIFREELLDKDDIFFGKSNDHYACIGLEKGFFDNGGAGLGDYWNAEYYTAGCIEGKWEVINSCGEGNQDLIDDFCEIVRDVASCVHITGKETTKESDTADADTGGVLEPSIIESSEELNIVLGLYPAEQVDFFCCRYTDSSGDRHYNWAYEGCVSDVDGTYCDGNIFFSEERCNQESASSTGKIYYQCSTQGQYGASDEVDYANYIGVSGDINSNIYYCCSYEEKYFLSKDGCGSLGIYNSDKRFIGEIKNTEEVDDVDMCNGWQGIDPWKGLTMGDIRRGCTEKTPYSGSTYYDCPELGSARAPEKESWFDWFFRL
jgi:hypothetical protein